MSVDFERRLYPIIDAAADHFGTPFHIYDEVGIRDTGRRLNAVFGSLNGFREYFAVKALPNPRVMGIMREMGFGFDCSSIAELALSRQVGATPDEIMFTSNNTDQEEFAAAAADGGSILNLDDISLVAKVPNMPELVCFRYNPGPRRQGNAIIGNPLESKYGVAHDQIVNAFEQARQRGARRFGLHTMVVSNERDYQYMVETTRMLLDLAERIHSALGIHFEFINIGGGLGINYHPEEAPLDLETLGRDVTTLVNNFDARLGWAPKLLMESGRFMTGPHGVLVARAINRKEIYRTYVGLDANMSALMRPGMYGAYHHITVPARMSATEHEIVDVVGALCENNDKFAIQRELPHIFDGDLVCIHDTGAHGHSMGFNYNGRLRPKELLLRTDGTLELIRRAETLEDHFTTLSYQPDVMAPFKAAPAA
jgi:diaminopimelate decarboxylase